jgi:hypothetical protein
MSMGRGQRTTSAAVRGDRRGAPGPRVRKWTDERIRLELERFLAGRDRWPTAAEFEAAGEHGLRHAVCDYGGVVHWAAVMRLPLAAGQDRQPYDLADALSDAQLVIGELGLLPNRRVLRARGHHRLATFIDLHCGGLKRFCTEHGLPRRGHIG